MARGRTRSNGCNSNKLQKSPPRSRPKAVLGADSSRFSAENSTPTRKPFVWRQKLARQPASGSGLSLLIPSWHAVLSDPGEFDTEVVQTFRCRHGLRRDLTSSALPTFPQSRFTRARISWLHRFAIRYGLSGCSPPCADLTGFPQPTGAFTSRLSADRSPSPPLDMTTTVNWTPLLAGLSPAA
jgi:hypothetical protein